MITGAIAVNPPEAEELVSDSNEKIGIRGNAGDTVADEPKYCTQHHIM